MGEGRIQKFRESRGRVRKRLDCQVQQQREGELAREQWQWGELQANSKRAVRAWPTNRKNGI